MSEYYNRYSFTGVFSFHLLYPRQIPVIVRRQVAEYYDQEEGAEHSISPGVKHVEEEYHEKGSGDGCRGVDIFDEDVGFLVCHDVSEGATTDTGHESQEDRQENVSCVPHFNADKYAINSEGCQPQSVEPEEHFIVNGYHFAGYGLMKVHKGEDQVSCDKGDTCIKWIEEYAWRYASDNDVAHESASTCCGDGQYIYTENVHFLLDAYEGARDGEGDGAN